MQKFSMTKGNIIWSYIGTVFSMASSFLVLPFIFYFLSSKEIGYWYLILGVNGLTVLLDFGFDPAFARNIAYIWSGISNLKKQGVEKADSEKVDYLLLADMIQTAKVVYLCIALIAVLMISVFGSLYMKNVVFNVLPGNIYVFSWIVFIVSIFFNLYFGYYSALLRGSGKVEHVNRAQVFARILQLVVTIVGFCFSRTILVPVIGLLVYGVAFRIFCNKYFWNDITIQQHKRVLKKKLNIKRTRDILKSIWPNTWRDGLVSISNYLSTQGMSLMAGIFLPLSMIGVYSIGIQFASALGTGAASINGAILPMLQSNFVKRNYEALKKETSLAISAYVWLYWIGAIAVISVIFPLLRLVKPESVPNIEVFSFMLIYFFLYQMHSAFASYIASFNVIPYMRAFIITAVVEIILLWILLSASGNIYTLLLIPILVQGVYNNWYWPAYYCRIIKSSFRNLLILGTQLIIKRFKENLIAFCKR